jgi:hypothetical protein
MKGVQKRTKYGAVRSVARVDTVEQATENECPICMEAFTKSDRNTCTPFSCLHVICVQCNSELYRRANDRCPTCRAQRTHESVIEQTATNQEARRQSLLQRASAPTSVMRIMFFPVGGVQESARVPHNATEHTSVSAYSVTDDSAVQRVVFGLTNPQSVSIGQFFVYAGDLVRYGGRVAGFDNAWVDNDA